MLRCLDGDGQSGFCTKRIEDLAKLALCQSITNAVAGFHNHLLVQLFACFQFVLNFSVSMNVEPWSYV